MCWLSATEGARLAKARQQGRSGSTRIQRSQLRSPWCVWHAAASPAASPATTIAAASAASLSARAGTSARPLRTPACETRVRVPLPWPASPDRPSTEPASYHLGRRPSNGIDHTKCVRDESRQQALCPALHSRQRLPHARKCKHSSTSVWGEDGKGVSAGASAARPEPNRA